MNQGDYKHEKVEASQEQPLKWKKIREIEKTLELHLQTNKSLY